MDLEKVIQALNSKTRREIIKILNVKPGSTNFVFNEIQKRRNIKVRHRESVYRALEKLVDVGIVKKYYSSDEGISYDILITKIMIDLIEDVVEKI